MSDEDEGGTYASLGALEAFAAEAEGGCWGEWADASGLRGDLSPQPFSPAADGRLAFFLAMPKARVQLRRLLTAPAEAQMRSNGRALVSVASRCYMSERGPIEGIGVAIDKG